MVRRMLSDTIFEFRVAASTPSRSPDAGLQPPQATAYFRNSIKIWQLQLRAIFLKKT